MTYKEYRDFVRDNCSHLKTTDDVNQGVVDILKSSFMGFGIKSFYKYASLDNSYTIDNIRNDIFHLSTLKQLNDIFEYAHLINGLNDPELFSGSTVANCLEIQRIIEKNYEHIKKHTTICSLTTSWNNRSMWGTYASAFKGICIEYDAVSIWGYFIDKLFPVVYSDVSPHKDIGQFIMGEAYSEKSFKDMVDNDEWEKYTVDNGIKEQLKFLVDICTTKNTDWETENEWRITDIAVNIPEERLRDGLNFEGVSELKPKSIIIGNHADSDKRKEIIDIAHLKKINVFQLEGNASTYELTKKPIE